ncbi:hypothetical protein K502DRAFT_332272 [Neoconidiobolus thromboides FSU 785]|nr:hypothetical protein K502DRAFT_332272 [Neoconidiobolus thromboides FSU 785]
MRFGATHPSFQWIKASGGMVPPTAVQGGREENGNPLFICRQWHKGGLHIGKVAPHLNGAYIAYGGKEISFKEYFVLCGDATQLRWIENKGKCLPQGWVPLEAGNEENGTELWIGKIRHENSEQIGKVSPTWNHGFNYGYGLKEVAIDPNTSYFVLALL